MKYGNMVFALTLLAGSVAGFTMAATPAGSVGDSNLLDGVAAQVNSDTITIGEVLNEVKNGAFSELSRAEQKAQLHSLYYKTLNAFVDRKLILAAAAGQERKLQSWVVDDRVQEIIDNRFNGDRTRLFAALTERHLSFDDWRKGIEEDLMLTAMRIEFVDKRVSISPQEIRGYYESNRQSLVSAGGVHVARITLIPGSKETVEELGDKVLKDLNSGVDFAEAAKRYSQDAYADKGGDMGFVEPGDKFADAIVKALAAIKPGQNTPLLSLAGRGFILRKVEEKTASVLTLEEAWPLIERRLRAQQSETLYREWTARLRRQNFVHIFPLPGLPDDK